VDEAVAARAALATALEAEGARLGDAPTSAATVYKPTKADIAAEVASAVEAALQQYQVGQSLRSAETDKHPVTGHAVSASAEALPDRAPQQGDDPRLRGGQERAGPRLEAAIRLGRSLTSEPATLQRFQDILDVGAKVQPTPTIFTHYKHAGVDGERSADPTFSVLQRFGLAPAPQSAGAAAADQVVAQAAKQAKDLAKKKAHSKSFESWWKHMSETGLLSARLRVSDPDGYAAADWLLKSVLHIFATEGWPTAAAYHDLIMERWAAGHLLVLDEAASEPCQRGDFEEMLVERVFYRACREASTKPKVTKKASSSATSGPARRKKQRSARCFANTMTAGTRPVQSTTLLLAVLARRRGNTLVGEAVFTGALSPAVSRFNVGVGEEPAAAPALALPGGLAYTAESPNGSALRAEPHGGAVVRRFTHASTIVHSYALRLLLLPLLFI
jgi:hypothetical protein